MPYLSPEDRVTLLVELDRQCRTCGKKVRRNYCRQCDEFFFECDCPPTHVGHRTYHEGGTTLANNKPEVVDASDINVHFGERPHEILYMGQTWRMTGMLGVPPHT